MLRGSSLYYRSANDSVVDLGGDVVGYLLQMNKLKEWQLVGEEEFTDATLTLNFSGISSSTNGVLKLQPILNSSTDYISKYVQFSLGLIINSWFKPWKEV